MKLCRSGLMAHVGVSGSSDCLSPTARSAAGTREDRSTSIRRAKLQPLFHCSGADGGGRTRTALRPRDFKSLPDVSGKPLITDENAKSIEKHLGKTTAIYCGRRILEAYCGGSRQKMTLTNC
jgi:hypothetical protein